MKNILVPTDFSKCANNALTYAFEIAKRTGGSLHLLHIVYPSEGVDNNAYQAFWIDNYLETRRKEMDRTVKQFYKNEAFRDIPVRTEVRIGFPATTTEDYAEEIHADLVVMGTTGATGLRGAILGSTTGTLISKTKRPVLAVPTKSSYRTSAQLAFATDFKMKLSQKSLDVLDEVVKVHHAKLKIVHILDKPGERPDKDAEARVSQKLNGIQHDFHYIHDADVPQAINDYIEATDTNALVTIAHEHSMWHKIFYESTSKTLAQHVHIPMLVLHDN